jgi:hypothetical protein
MMTKEYIKTAQQTELFLLVGDTTLGSVSLTTFLPIPGGWGWSYVLMLCQGGFANRYIPTTEEDDEARQNNENMRRQSVASVAERRKSLAGGNVIGDVDGARRGSLTSMRNFVFGGRRESRA